MKIIGRKTIKHKKGFTEELNSFFQLMKAFRKNNTLSAPRGIFRFKSFEEAQDDERQISRPPTIDDLVAVCKKLNDNNVKYVLIGGFAINYHGFSRATTDIDILVCPSKENISEIKQALSFLSDNAIKEIDLDDVEKYEVVRVADEITIDLLKSACGMTYENAGIEYFEFKGIKIPIADLITMIKTKQGIRPRDKDDLAFLLSLLEEEMG